jgi:phosphomannomutase
VEEFNYRNITAVTKAIANLVKEKYKKLLLLYDTRFMSKDFVKTAVKILTENGIKSLLCKKDTPTLVIAYSV